MPIILREYQEVVKDQIYKEWDSGTKNVLLTMPTGMGKTKTFCSITIDKAVTPPPSQRLPTAIAVHRKELVQQISLTLAEVGVKHNIIAQGPTIKGIIAAQRKEYRASFYDYNASISVISVDTLNSRILRHKKWAESIKLWITDEAAHVLKDNKWGRALSYFPNAIGLGVTATPQRLDRRGLGTHADGVFDRMVLGPTTRWGIDNGYLSRYKVVISESDYKLHLKQSNGDSDYSHEAMAVAAEKSKIVGDVVYNYKKHAMGKQAIVFASDIASGTKIENKFLEAGIKAKILTSFDTDSTRLNSMIEYRERKIQVLINVDLFDEGLDVPGIEAVIMARPTMSLSKFLQMVGRGLRPMATKEYLILIDHVGNVREHGLPCSDRDWTLDRIVKRRQRINLIRICKNFTCNAPFDRILTKCPYCGQEDTPASRDSSGGGRVSPEMVDGDLVMLDPETIREMEYKVRLEDPAKLAQRVAAAAGPDAAQRALRLQMERIATQKTLSETVAIWAGLMRENSCSDRSIHKEFFKIFDMTITGACSEPRAEMDKTIAKLNNEIEKLKFRYNNQFVMRGRT